MENKPRTRKGAMQLVAIGLAVIIFIGILMVGAAFVSSTYAQINQTAPSALLNQTNTGAGTMFTTLINIGGLVILILMLALVLYTLMGIAGGHKE